MEPGMTTDIVDVKAALTESPAELHLPTVRRTYLFGLNLIISAS
jgi:hypothetical protein